MINKIYLNKISDLKEHFSKNGSLILHEFLSEDIKKEVLNLKFIKEYSPMKYSYSKSNFKLNNEILDFISKILGKEINNNFESFSFGWKDYTILSDEINYEYGIDIIIDFADDWDSNFGGSIVYVDGSGNYTKIEPSSNTLILFDKNFSP